VPCIALTLVALALLPHTAASQSSYLFVWAGGRGASEFIATIDAREWEDAMNGVSCDPMFDLVRRNPRFIALMQRMAVHVCPAA
jgi:hypothetical protein